MSKLSFNSDLHVHTNLSPCAGRHSTPESYLLLCAEAGIDTIGFSNHLWDSDVPGANGWYSELSVPHILKIRDQIQDTHGVRVLVGCEAEFNGKLALTKENAASLDYALVVTSHYHHDKINDGVKTDTPADVRLLMVERFLMGVSEAAELPIPTAMAHMFHPLGFPHYEEEAVNGICDRTFEECFSFAARKNVALEVHLATLTGDYAKDDRGLARHAARMLEIAISCGCRFTFGSDIHVPEGFVDRNNRLRECAEKLGITPDMMMEV